MNVIVVNQLVDFLALTTGERGFMKGVGKLLAELKKGPLLSVIARTLRHDDSLA